MSLPSPAMGRIAARGALWFGAASVAAKSSALLMQVILGWLLTSEDFGRYATVVGVMAFTMALQSGGINKFLRSQPHRFRELAGAAAIAGIACSVAAASILVGLAIASPWLQWLEGLAPLLWVAAAASLLAPLESLQRARLEIDLRFGRLAAIDVAVILARAATTVLLAWFGFGAMSLIAAMLLGTALAASLLAMSGGLRDVRVRGVRAREAIAILRRTRLIMLFLLAGSLSLRSDFLVLGLVAPAMLGLYFFGFQLSVSSLQMLSAVGVSVIPSIAARLSGDRARIGAAMVRLLRINAWLVVPASTMAWLLLPAAMHLMWQGRWDAAAPLAAAIALSTAVRGLVPICDAMLEGVGAWRALVAMEFGESSFRASAIVVAVAMSDGDLAIIAWTIAAVRVGSGGVRLLVCASIAGASPRALAANLAPIVGGGAAIALLAGLLANSLPGGPTAAMPALASAGVAAAGWVALMALCGRAALSELRLLRRGAEL